MPLRLNLPCLPSSRQDIVELRRFHLAGAGEVGRLNYIFIGNPGTGKVRGYPAIYLYRLYMHAIASHRHALPRPAVLQTSIARVWARLLGQLGLRPNAEDEAAEQKALADAAAAAGAASVKSDDERARDALALKMLQVDAEKHGAAVAAARRVLESARAARDAAATYEEGIRGFPVSPDDLPGTRHKATMELRTAAALRRSGEDASSAEAALRTAEAEQARARRALEAAQARQADLSDAAATSATAAALAAQAAAAAPPQRFWELKGHELANEPDGKKRLLDIVSTLMDPRLNTASNSGGGAGGSSGSSSGPRADRRGGTILIDEAHNLDPQSTPHGKAVLQYLLTAAEDHRAHLTFILTGYKKDIDEKLLTADPGL